VIPPSLIVSVLLRVNSFQNEFVNADGGEHDADVHLLASGPDKATQGKVTENGKPTTPQREKDGYLVQIGSGSYAFEVP
jgi:hypothetical protein